MFIRSTAPEDLDTIKTLYEVSKKFMADNGNPDQWGEGVPTFEMVGEDMRNGCSYVCIEEGEILATFMFTSGPEPLYEEFETEWLNDRPYGVVHRLASGGARKGAGEFCVKWCFERCGNLRVDTHEKNLPMQNLLAKLEFTYCGITQGADGTPRLAYQKSLDD